MRKMPTLPSAFGSHLPLNGGGLGSIPLAACAALRSLKCGILFGIRALFCLPCARGGGTSLRVTEGLFFVKRKPRDSRVVEKRLTGERKSSKYVIIEATCQSKLKNIFGGFIYEKSDHRQ